MANSLAPRKADGKICTYDSNGQEVKLSLPIIKNYLVSGDSSRVTDQECMMFLNLCRYQQLNPFLREAYLIKYGNSAATIVVGKDVFTKRARRQKDFRGFSAGIVVYTDKGEIVERDGMIYLPTEKLIGGWASVYIDGYLEPVKVTVPFNEYAARKADGKLNAQWASKPATMIRKVALVQALREAFPEELGGMYSQEEMTQVEGVENLPTEPVKMPEAEEKAEAEEVVVVEVKEAETEAEESVDSILFG